MIEITANSPSIEVARWIAKPWIRYYDGCEWGDSMRGLHIGCHTDYALENSECAIVAKIMWDNIEKMFEYSGYCPCPGCGEEEANKYTEQLFKEVAKAKEHALSRFVNSKYPNGEPWADGEKALATLNSFPKWVFERVERGHT